MEQSRDTQKLTKKKEGSRVSWRSESLGKTFLEACLHEVVKNVWKGAFLKPQSWKRVGEILKDTHNLIVDQK